VRRALAFTLGVGLGANSIWMLLAPETWYHAVPGVADTGPMNLHFIRDIGCAYFVVALSLVRLARSPMHAWPATLAGGAFLALHAVVHVWDFRTGREHAHGFLNDLPGVFFPAILTLWLAWPPRPGPKMG